MLSAAARLAARSCGPDCSRPRPAQGARCTKIIKPGTEEAKYVINVKQIAKAGSLPTACSTRLHAHAASP